MEESMRTNVVIDDELMEKAMKLAGTRTKRETVEEGLRLLVRLRRQKNVRRIRGKLRWQGDLEEMRRDR
jgi:Arc/MetJ family transcription regulator